MQYYALAGTVLQNLTALGWLACSPAAVAAAAALCSNICLVLGHQEALTACAVFVLSATANNSLMQLAVDHCKH